MKSIFLSRSRARSSFAPYNPQNDSKDDLTLKRELKDSEGLKVHHSKPHFLRNLLTRKTNRKSVTSTHKETRPADPYHQVLKGGDDSHCLSSPPEVEWINLSSLTPGNKDRPESGGSFPLNDLNTNTCTVQNVHNVSNFRYSPMDETVCSSISTNSERPTVTDIKQWKRQLPSWFSPTLGYVFEAEKQDRNEVRVLALGVHQYIEEVFYALDVDQRGYIHSKDLKILCKLIGKDPPPEGRNEQYCAADDSSMLCGDVTCPVHVHYTEFKKKILSLFETSEPQSIFEHRSHGKLIETVAKVTRKVESLNYIAKLLEELEEKIKYLHETEGSATDDDGYCNNNFIASRTYMKNLDLEYLILLQIQELQCLREIIEDFRIALQSSDAENLALTVRATKKGGSERPCSKCSSTERKSSFPNEDDSIDQLIMNFPSSEYLLSSSSEKKPRQINEDVSPPSRLKEDLYIDGDYQEISEGIYEDVALLRETDRLKQDLFDSKTKLAQMKLELEASLAENRSRTREQTETKSKLAHLASDLQATVDENLYLIEEIQKWRTQFEAQSHLNKEMEQELILLRGKLDEAATETEETKQHLRQTKKRRRHELRQLTEVRKLLVDVLMQTKPPETPPNDSTPDRKEVGNLIIDGVGNSAYWCPQTPQMDDLTTTRKTTGDFHLSDTSDATDFRPELMRHQWIDENHDASKPEATENQLYYQSDQNASNHSNRVGAIGNSKPTKKKISEVPSIFATKDRLQKSRSLNKSIFFSEAKPILEVKPNVIRLWKSPGEGGDEGEVKGGEASLPPELDEESLVRKVSAELCREIAETFSVLNEAADDLFSDSSLENGSESNGGNETLGLDLGNEPQKWRRKRDRRRSWDSKNDGVQKHVKFSNDLDIICDNPRNYGHIIPSSPRDVLYEADSFSFAANANCSPSKDPLQSSTQFLENLELEVDQLRRSLDEDYLWG